MGQPLPGSQRSDRQPMDGAWVVEPAEAGHQLAAFLAASERLGSRGRVKWAIERGKVTLNDEDVLPEHAAKPLSIGDRLRLWVDRPGSARARRRPIRATDGRLAVVYEDASIVVVNKPPGLLSVPLARRSGAPSVEDLLAGYLRSKGKRRPFVVHRIDRDTSGLVVFAITPVACDALKEQFARREPERVYLAVVSGTPDPPSGVWHDYVRWDSDRVEQVLTDAHDARGRACVTEYCVLESFDRRASLVQFRLQTGRRNQIRVQAWRHGHPLVGERMYVDGKGAQPGEDVARQALHAWKLGFAHPETGRSIRVVAPLPADLRKLLTQLRGTRKHEKMAETVDF